MGEGFSVLQGTKTQSSLYCLQEAVFTTYEYSFLASFSRSDKRGRQRSFPGSIDFTRWTKFVDLYRFLFKTGPLGGRFLNGRAWGGFV